MKWKNQTCVEDEGFERFDKMDLCTDEDRNGHCEQRPEILERRILRIEQPTSGAWAMRLTLEMRGVFSPWH